MELPSLKHNPYPALLQSQIEAYFSHVQVKIYIMVVVGALGVVSFTMSVIRANVMRYCGVGKDFYFSKK